MADLNRLTKLFQAIAARDWHSAEEIAGEVANGEERIGHHAAAQRLRGALRSNGHSSPVGSLAPDSHAGQPGSAFLSSALTRLAADRSLQDIQLKPTTRKILKETIVEWLHREELAARHFERRTKLLFHGPPGCGKSVTARALARELGLPIYVVRFDAIVGAFLGQTALHLRQLFRFAEVTPCVVLVDEIDALGKRRGSPLDVGELDRVVIALLQELEHSCPAGLLIATSNVARQLDDALWRRFDLVLEFPSPSSEELRRFSVQRAKVRDVNLDSRFRAALTRAKSYAEVERLIASEQIRRLLKFR